MIWIDDPPTTDPVYPGDCELMVCVFGGGLVRVYGPRTPKSVAALRMVADSMEQYPSGLAVREQLKDRTEETS